MDSSSIHQSYSPKPKRLKTLASNVKFSEGNVLLHRLVLENSDPNDLGSEIYVRAVLLSMSDAPATAVNALSDEGYSALHLAVLNDNLTLVRKLLSCLANIDVNARCGRGDGETALHLAVASGHLAIIRELLNKGASIDVENRKYETALTAAIKLRALETVKMLVSSADVNQRNSFTTLLRVAACYGSPEIAEFLIDEGADLEERQGGGRTALHHAALWRNLDVVKLLVRKGADLHATNVQGRTPLHDAVWKGNSATAAFLLDQGARFQADIDGWTPLHDAAHNGHVRLLRALLDKGANVNAKNADGKTPLDLARRGQNQGCIKALQRHRDIIFPPNYWKFL